MLTVKQLKKVQSALVNARDYWEASKEYSWHHLDNNCMDEHAKNMQGLKDILETINCAVAAVKN